MEECINYTYSLLELIIPSIQIQHKFCSSIDKTNLLIISLLRLFIVYRLFNYLNNNGLVLLSLGNPIKLILFIICLVYFTINVVYIGIIFYKKPEYDQQQLEQEAGIISLALEQNKVGAELSQ